jgi:hypothetical protein
MRMALLTATMALSSDGSGPGAPGKRNEVQGCDG